MQEAIVRCRNHPEIDQGCRPCSRCGSWFCPNCLVDLGGQAFCAGCKVERLRDFQAGVPAAGVWLDLASIGRRFAAVLIDSLIFTIPAILVMILVIALMGVGLTDLEQGPETPGVFETAFGLAYLTFLAIGTLGRVLYEGFMLAKRGQTLGKIAMSIKVVTPEGHDLRPGQAWNRAILRLALDTCLSFINYLPAFFSREKTTIHDITAKTRVINWRV